MWDNGGLEFREKASMITPQPEGVPGVQSMIASSGRGGPTAIRILLGAQLRRLREARQITLEDAGYAIRASGSKISRLETGRVGFKSRDIADLLTLYGVTSEQDRSAMQELARQASAVGWWHDYADVMPNWFEPYVGLEEAAASIRSYEIQFVPGLLQTADYARAVALLGHPARPADEVERRVSLRMARQAVLYRATPVHLWAVLDEAVLLRPIGGADVMRGQLEHLIEISARPNVSLQLVPLELGGHAAAGGPFSILRFGERDLPDLVYLEQLTSALYLDKRETVDHYLFVMDRLCVAALSTSDSVDAIRARLKGR
jgi:transcriptional regulator with XRE-family HTH domain